MGSLRDRSISALALGASAAVAATRLRRRREPATGYRNTPFWRTFDSISGRLDRRYGWHAMPVPLGALVLIGVRNVLRKNNLFDTDQLPSTGIPPAGEWKPEYRTQRTADGSYNDLDQPAMGRVGMRFGRNMPFDTVGREPIADVMDPNPRVVSRELMTRHEFQPVTALNALTAVWLQFMIRDWFGHGRGSKDNIWEIRLPAGDTWEQDPMQVPKNPRDPMRPDGDGDVPTFVNTETHWWDGSSIYGVTQEQQDMIRSRVDGKLNVLPDGKLPYPDDPRMDPRMVPGFWLGMGVLARLFVLEHNAICDLLKQAYPSWSDEDLFQRARLINAAVMAKIHTIEWTPAVISHPTTVIAMNANWYGLAGKRITSMFGRLSGSEVISGIPGSERNHYGVPFTLTEEFASVYRMHPLITDDWTFFSHSDHSETGRAPFRDLTDRKATEYEDRMSLTDIIYSFGHNHPGQIRLHNFPRDLQHFVRPDGEVMDLATVDILRTRELGVPRYNQFRRLLHLKPAESFETLTDVPEWADQMRRIYDDDIEKVDLIVGMFAEPLPQGFAFSDTAFRIFILMASRRLNSDRFFTTDYTPQVYTPVGMDWINRTDMSSILLRHCPELAPALNGLPHAFATFNPASVAAAAAA